MSRLASILAAALLLPAVALADEPAKAEPAKTPKITLSGLVDSYYAVNLTHAQDYPIPTVGYTSPTGFNLNFAKLGVLAELDPVAFHLELGFGQVGEAITGSLNPAALSVTDLFVEQAYASLKFGALTVDAGRFVTPAGFEVYENNLNWLYTKSLLFNFALPIAHVGARASLPLTDALTGAVYLTNGSDLFANDTGHTGSPYKTAGLNLVFSKGDTAAAATAFYSYIPGTAGKSAYLVDANVSQTFGALSLDLWGDYGSAYNATLDKDSSWAGVALSGKYAITDALTGVARVDYLSDKDGFHTALAPAKSFSSYTAGASYAVGSNAALKAEVRLDHASEKVYRGDKSSAAALTVAALAWF